MSTFGTASPRAWSLRRRIGALLLAVGIVLLAVVGSSFVLLLQVRDAQDRVVKQYFEAILGSSDAFTGLVDAETSVRGYALTGEAKNLKPLEQLQDPSSQTPAYKSRQAALQRVINSDPQIKAAADKAAEAARAWYFTWAQPLIESVRLGGPTAVAPQEIERGTQ